MISRGVISRILNKEEVPNPVLLVQECKPMNAGNDTSNRYKLSLSDGVTTIPGMLTQQLNNLVTEGLLTPNKLIQISQYMCNVMGATQILILCSIEIVGEANAGSAAPFAPSFNPQAAAIPSYGAPAVPSYGAGNTYGGAPQSYGGPPSYGAPVTPSYGAPVTPAYGAPSGYGVPTAGYGAPVSGYGAPAAPAVGGYGASTYGKAIVRDEGNAMVTPIRDINPYSNKWTIKARVTRKAEIKRWSNAKGEGTLFSIDLLDSQGTEIRATFFKEACDKFYSLIEEGKAYLFSGGKLKVVTNPQYSTIKNNYELTFDVSSEIRFSQDDDGIKKATFKFTKIAQIANLETGAMCDVIGIVRSASQLSEISSAKMGGKILQKKDLNIYDDTNTEVRITLWGEKAADPKIQWEGSIVAFKGVKVGDYQGKNLGSMGSSQILVAPDIPEGHQLFSWLQNNASAASQLMSLSTTGSGDNRGVESLEKRKHISHIREEGLGHGEKGDYVSFKGTITYIKHDSDPWYIACPNEGCSKKVISLNNGLYRCEKCNNEYPSCDYRYILSFTVSDQSGQQWVSSFNDMGEIILGTNAKTINDFKLDRGSDAANVFYNDALFKTYLMRARVKFEQVNDEQRLKVTILKADPVDWVSESLQILDAIRKYD